MGYLALEEMNKNEEQNSRGSLVKGADKHMTLWRRKPGCKSGDVMERSADGRKPIRGNVSREHAYVI